MTPADRLALPLRPFGRRGLLVAGLGLVAAACSPSTASGPPAAPASTANPLIQPKTGAPLTVALPNSDLAVGPNRFVLALLDAQNKPIPNSKHTLRFFKVNGDGTATMKFETAAKYYVIGPGDRGLYVARTNFDESGNWGLEASVIKSDDTPLVSRVSFTVQAASQTPAIGAACLPTKQELSTDKPIKQLCSANPPDPMHDITVADALKLGKPLVLMLGSPGFCTSATCGPNLEHLLAARQQYGSQIEFIHIEIYKDAKPPSLVPAVNEWHLPSEPWTFLVDAGGKIVDKLEGGVAPDELEPALAKLIA